VSGCSRRAIPAPRWPGPQPGGVPEQRISRRRIRRDDRPSAVRRRTMIDPEINEALPPRATGRCRSSPAAAAGRGRAGGLAWARPRQLRGGACPRHAGGSGRHPRPREISSRRSAVHGLMLVTYPIGWLVSPILLLVLFYGMFTPLALVLPTDRPGRARPPTSPRRAHLLGRQARGDRRAALPSSILNCERVL
jgi:hypothetical protein